MKTEELAEKAYDAIKNPVGGYQNPENVNLDFVHTEPEAFENLPKSLQHQFLEIAERGGDSTPFGQEVERILAEQRSAYVETFKAPATEEEIHELDGTEELATEAHTRAHLETQSLDELKALAKQFTIEHDENLNHAGLVDLILANVATREVVEAKDAEQATQSNQSVVSE